MKKTQLTILWVIIFTLFFMVLPYSSNAQQYWMNLHEGNSIGLKIMKPFFDSEFDNVGFMTSTWFISGQHYTSDNLAIVYELPISNFSPESETIFDQGETAIGNPYIGIKYSKKTRGENRFITHLGVKLPVVSRDHQDAASVGILSNYEQFETFQPEYMIFSFAGTFHSKPRTTSALNISLGGSYMKSTDDRDSEVILHYNADFISTSSSNLILGAGFTGVAILTASGASFGERSVHQFALLGGHNGQKFNSAITFKIPIDEDLGEAISFVLGFNFIYKLN